MASLAGEVLLDGQDIYSPALKLNKIDRTDGATPQWTQGASQSDVVAIATTWSSAPASGDAVADLVSGILQRRAAETARLGAREEQPAGKASAAAANIVCTVAASVIVESPHSRSRSGHVSSIARAIAETSTSVPMSGCEMRRWANSAAATRSLPAVVALADKPECRPRMLPSPWSASLLWPPTVSV